jgi:hypothetical protein
LQQVDNLGTAALLAQANSPIAALQQNTTLHESPFASADSARHRWQFSLRGLLLFMVSVAVGASVVEVKYLYYTHLAALEATERQQRVADSPSPQAAPRPVDLDWNSGLTAAFVFWMILGLFYQLRDQRRFLALHSQIDREQRAGLRFEVFWRAAVISLLLLYAVTALLLFQNAIALPDSEEFLIRYFGGGAAMREAILVILLILIVASVPFIPRKVRFPWLHAIIDLTACICAFGLCLYRWSDSTFTHYLTHIATYGIDIATSLNHCTINAHDYPRDCSLFFYWSLVSSGLVVFNWICLRRLADRWSPGGIRRWFWLGLFSLGIAAVSDYVLWVYLHGLRQISPAFAESGVSLPYHYWVVIGLIFLILTTALTYRMAVEKGPPSEGPCLSWRENAGKYFHEWRTFLIGLAAMDVGFRMYGVVQASLQPAVGIRRLSFFDYLGYLYVCMPAGCLWLALVVLALSRATAKQADPDGPRFDIPRLSAAKFIAIWLATAVLLVSGSLTLVWLSFALWFNPWFGGR